ncbi:MAG TPA: hypothetical protein VKV40_01370 [Ktedonobacteraceae bacterium]|nr:hypothetical protein [Ktedonobacteraceae bacterium]
MLLSDVETAVRQDLFDPLSGSNPRWQNSDIDRAIDKAVNRYSQYYPNIVFTDMPSQPFQRTYPYPVSWNAAYPVWWIERVLYPLQSYGSYFPAPGAGMTASVQTGSGLSAGTYAYALTYLSQGGETTPSPLVTVTTTNGNQQVLLVNIPIGPAAPSTPGAATNTVIGRNLYRTQVGGSQLYLLTTLADNTTTQFVDSSADTVIAFNPPPPTVNTSGVMLWPPFERDFAEYSNLFDSTAALAAGGNLGAQGAIGVGTGPTGTAAPTFTIKLSSAELPQDSTLVLRVFYATKHQLDYSGSTIPEAHRDIIVLGACAYAMEAYQVPTNDNFDFQDGALRDRVDDTHIPTAWQQAAQNKMQQFEARLAEIKEQRDFAASSRAHWGDIAARYERL